MPSYADGKDLSELPLESLADAGFRFSAVPGQNQRLWHFPRARVCQRSAGLIRKNFVQTAQWVIYAVPASALCLL